MAGRSAKLLFAVLILLASASYGQQANVLLKVSGLHFNAVDLNKAKEGVFVFYGTLLDKFSKAKVQTDAASWKVFFDGKEKKGQLSVSTLSKSKEGMVAAAFIIAHDDKSVDDGVYKDSKEGVQRILGKLRPRDRSFAVVYANTAADSGSLALGHNETSGWLDETNKVKGAIPALYDGIEKALNAFPADFKTIGPNRALVLVTDGADRQENNGNLLKERVSKIISLAEELNVRFLVVGIAYNLIDPNDDEGLKRIKKLAKLTGGTYRQVDDQPQIEQYLSHIEDELVRQHVVTFITNDFKAKATNIGMAVNHNGNEYRSITDKIVKLPEPQSKLWWYVAMVGGGLVGLFLLFLIGKMLKSLMGNRRKDGPVAVKRDQVQCAQCNNVRPGDWKVCKYCEALPHLGRLKVVSGGDLNGFTFFIKDSLTNIGSAEDNNFMIADASVSKRHAGIKVQDSRFELADYGSTNGVLVNGQRITKQFLKAGDTLSIGMVELEFTLKA